MIVPFYVQMTFDADKTHRQVEEISRFLRDKMHLAVYQGPPLYGKTIMDMEEENESGKR